MRARFLKALYESGGNLFPIGRRYLDGMRMPEKGRDREEVYEELERRVERFIKSLRALREELTKE